MKKNVKIDIPYKKADELITVAEKMLAKDEEMGAESLLKNLDRVTFKKNLADAKAKRAEALKLHGQAEELNQKANLSLGIDSAQSSSTPGTVYNFIASARDILVGSYKGQEKMLQEWGLGVTITEGTKKKTTTTAK